MFAVVLAPVIILAQLFAHLPAADPPPTTTQASSQPTSQPAVAQASHKRDLMSAMRGDTTLTLNEIVRPQFWQQSVNDFVLGALSFVPKLIVAFVLFFIFWVIYRGIRRITVGSMTRAGVDPSIRDMLSAVLRWAIMGFGCVIACNQVGIQITALLTGVSIIGIAIGFAAQETLANFIAGIVIFWDKPFKVGDWVTVDGQFGQVLRVSFRSTRVVSADGEMIVMPNTFMLAHRVANHSVHEVKRVNVQMMIPRQVSIRQARQVLLGLTETDDRIRREPAPAVVVSACDDTGTTLTLQFWIADVSFERSIFHEYLEEAKHALDAVEAAPGEDAIAARVAA